MDKLHLRGQLTQLLNRGYTIEDVRHMITAPKSLVDQVIAEYMHDSDSNQQHLSTQHNQAKYAMHLGSGR